MTYYSRAAWKARASRGGTQLERSEVVGVALHWPGDSVKRTTVKQVQQALRAWQTDHMDNPAKRWSDIAYQAAIDQAGNVYSLRGLRYRSAANGDQDVNHKYGAFLLVLAVGEKPSAAMIRATRHLVAKHRSLFPHSDQVVPHSQIRPKGTECPGDLVRALIDRGEFG